MKKTRAGILTFVTGLFLSSCAVVSGIFKAGVAAGVFAVLAVIVIIILVIRSITKRS